MFFLTLEFFGCILLKFMFQKWKKPHCVIRIFSFCFTTTFLLYFFVIQSKTTDRCLKFSECIIFKMKRKNYNWFCQCTNMTLLSKFWRWSCNVNSRLLEDNKTILEVRPLTRKKRLSITYKIVLSIFLFFFSAFLKLTKHRNAY